MSLHDGEHPSAIFLLDLEDSLAHLGQFVDNGFVGLQLLLQTVILTCNYLPFLRSRSAPSLNVIVFAM